MATNRSDKSRFPSRHGGGYVTPAQYITECLCVLIALQQRKQLGDQFWNHSPWDKVFRTQIPAASSLLKTYSPNVILAALRDKRCRKIQSLRAKWLLEPILKEKQREEQVRESQQATVQMEKTSTTQKPRSSAPTGNKMSLFARLREIEKNERRPD